MNNRRIVLGLPVVVVATLVLGGCVSQRSAQPSQPAGQGGTVTVDLHPDGCTPSPAKVNAGSVDFKVTNVDADRVSEAELLSGGKVMGEQENLSPGLDGGFSLHLDAGDYQLYCPGAAQEKASFTVVGTSEANWKSNPALVRATVDYGTYVTGEVNQLVSTTQAFVAAATAGDLAKAKVAYGQARVHYERVEPVAEIWGELDKNIDGRIDDFDNPQDFKGFHKLEQMIFQQNTLNGAAPIATELLRNVRELQTLVSKAGYQPAEIANGSTELVDEIQKTKVTGEEERYSHIDLVDFQGNLDGAMTAFGLLKPALTSTDPDLVTTIVARDKAVEQALAKYRRQPGYLDTGYVDYSTVSKDEQRRLSQAVNALGEELSKVAAKVAS